MLILRASKARASETNDAYPLSPSSLRASKARASDTNDAYPLSLMPSRLLSSTSTKLHVAARSSTRCGLIYHSKYAKSLPRPEARHASYYASSTAINASKEVPEQYRSLYAGLDGLKRDAANYVDPSRLQLALRSLESQTPVIRIAGACHLKLEVHLEVGQLTFLA